MKRILSLLLSVVMLVSTMSLVDFSAFAASMPTTTITSVKAQSKALLLNGKKNQVLQDTKFSILPIRNLKRTIRALLLLSKRQQRLPLKNLSLRKSITFVFAHTKR